MRISYSLTALANAISAILIAAGTNVTKWAGSNVAAPNVAGYPLVDTHYHRGTAESVLIANRRDVNVGAMQADALSAAAVSAAAATKIYPGMVTADFSGGGTWQNDGDTIDVAITALTVARSYVLLRYVDLKGAAAVGRRYSWAITSTTNVRFTLRETLGGAESPTFYFTTVSQ